MIAVDTNVLARSILDDDEEQSPIAKDFLRRHTEKGRLYLSPFVMMELVWVLKSRGLKRHQIVPILEKLTEIDGIDIGKRNVIVSALNLYRKFNISFSDCLIAADGQITANARTASFDEALRKSIAYCVDPKECK